MTITIEGNRVVEHIGIHGLSAPCHTSGTISNNWIWIDGEHVLCAGPGPYDDRDKCDSKKLIAMLPWVDLVAELNGVDLPTLTAAGLR